MRLKYHYDWSVFGTTLPEFAKSLKGNGFEIMKLEANVILATKSGRLGLKNIVVGYLKDDTIELTTFCKRKSKRKEILK